MRHFFAHYLLIKYRQGIVMQDRICQTYHNHNDYMDVSCAV